MENKKIVRIVNTFFLIVTVITFALSVFYDSAFIPSFMLMLSLFLFGICYYNGSENKKMTYGLFTIGVLLIIGSLIYTFMRIL